MDKSKQFATLRFNKNQQRDILLKALDHVRHFIIKRKLILVGGMSIDCNLRLKNMKLYDDDQIPDYDFYSSENAEDAYLLGSELCTAGFPQIDVITAIHTTTMKVRVDGNVVADITYMPKKIFDTIRTHEFKGMRIIHPWYTMMDQWRSLSLPYENPPNEVITERWNKDIDRFNMLYRAYPIFLDKEPEMPKIRRVRLPRHEHTVLSGWAALAFYHKKFGVKSDLKYTDTEVHIPVDRVTLMTDHIENFYKPDAKYFNALFSFPRHIRIGNLEIFDVFGERITVCDDTPHVVSLASLMFYFMHTWLLRQDAVSYLGVRSVYGLLESQKIKLDVTPFGDSSWNISTQYSIANILDYTRVKNWKPQPQQFATDDCDVKRKFDPSQSLLFNIDENETSHFTDIVSRDKLQLKH